MKMTGQNDWKSPSAETVKTIAAMKIIQLVVIDGSMMIIAQTKVDHVLFG